MCLMDFRGRVATSQWRSNGGRYMTIKLHAMTWLHLGAPSLIEHMWLNGNDLHSSILSELLIEDEELNPMAMPNLAYKYTSFTM